MLTKQKFAILFVFGYVIEKNNVSGLVSDVISECLRCSLPAKAMPNARNGAGEMVVSERSKSRWTSAPGGECWQAAPGVLGPHESRSKSAL